MQLNALFCCLWRSVKASCHKYIALVSFSQSYAKKVQFTEDNGHLSVSNSLPLFNFTISKLPSMFNSYLTHTSSIHHYSTRSSISGFAMPSVRTKIRQRSIKYKGPFVWNKLSTEIKNLPSVSTFKTKLKQYTLDSY